MTLNGMPISRTCLYGEFPFPEHLSRLLLQLYLTEGTCPSEYRAGKDKEISNAFRTVWNVLPCSSEERKKKSVGSFGPTWGF